MPQNRFVLLHQDGQYLSNNDGNHWICVRDPMAATVLTETKATNILQNMIKPKEREHWKLQLYSAPAQGEGGPTVENIPQEEVPALESAPDQPEKPAAKPRRGKKAAVQPAETPDAKKQKPAPAPAAEKKAAEAPAPSEEKNAPAPAGTRAAEEKNPPAPKQEPAAKKQSAGKPAKVVPAKAQQRAGEDPFQLVSQWMDRAADLKRQYENLIQRKKDLSEELRQVSAELCDLEHYIEFTSLNAAKGYRIYRRLRDCLIRRRKIKDELMCITIFLKAEPHNILNGNLYRQFSGLKTREYSPRVLEDLFQEMGDEKSAPKKENH